jgi:hypothetical protein
MMMTWFYYFYYRCLKWYKSQYYFNPKAAGPLQVSVGANLATIALVVWRLYGSSKGESWNAAAGLFAGLFMFAGGFFVAIFLIAIPLWVTEKTIVRRCQEFERESAEEQARRNRIYRWYFWLTYLLFLLAAVS